MAEQNLNDQQQPYMRRIRSFVRREGRLTKGQAAALEKYWPTMGLDATQAPFDFPGIFGRQAPVVLEIGFGMGHSLVSMAQADPAADYVGIEVHRPGVGACLMEAEAQQVKNLRVIEHDAVEVLENWVPDRSLDKVQIYFPDPWHKKRHHKRRIIQPHFMVLLAQKMKPAGILHLATDWENYAEHMLEVINPLPEWENLAADQSYLPRPPERPLTKFEQRGQRKGHGVWDMKFRYNPGPGQTRV